MIRIYEYEWVWMSIDSGCLLDWSRTVLWSLIHWVSFMLPIQSSDRICWNHPQNHILSSRHTFGFYMAIQNNRDRRYWNPWTLCGTQKKWRREKKLRKWRYKKGIKLMWDNIVYQEKDNKIKRNEHSHTFIKYVTPEMLLWVLSSSI